MESKWYSDDYKPKKINWKKTGIVLSVITLVLGTIVLIWGFAIGGFSFLSLRSYAKDSYITMYHEKDLSFCKDSENFNYKYKGVDDGNGGTLPNPQTICENNVNNMINNKLRQSKKIEIGLKKKINNTNYELAIRDLKWDITREDYLKKDPGNDSKKDILLKEVTLIEIQKIDGRYKIVQLLKNYETREDFDKRNEKTNNQNNYNINYIKREY